jgi:hypothetical protein
VPGWPDVNKYLLIEGGRAWVTVTARAGSSTTHIKHLALKSLPHRAERIEKSIVRLKLGIPQEVLT